MHQIDPRARLAPEAVADRLDRLERLADTMDSRYRVPGTSIRFGWDAILGLVPGLGDIATLGPGAYILLEGHRMGAPAHVKGRMAFNIGLDWIVGSVPLLGDVFDVFVKANRKNVALLREHFGHRRDAAPAEQPARGDVP